MPWLVALLVLVAVAGAAAWMRGLHTVAAVMVVPLFVLLFLVGRRIEGQRDEGWSAAASAVQGTFRTGTAADCASFGRPAPWDDWARHGELQCPRLIDGRSTQPPFALLQVRYSVRESRGEEHPDTWYEVTVAVLPLAPGAAGAPGGTLQPVAATPGHAGVHNGQAVFVWKQGTRGAGEPLPAGELPALLEEGRRAAATLRR
ncbi:hypothetical protein [Ramlibacter sp. AN1133]|uniref:hypothetical protein n=1 Tax=Ramlibacter sp. AN1133 TaxID=3133429 RepID=UPI0030C08252